MIFNRLTAYGLNLRLTYNDDVRLGKRPQRHVKYQLGTFLVRYASLGSDTLWTAQKLSIGFGSVFNYCRRVTKAIRQLRDQHVGWPTAERKLVIAAAMGAEGFHKCLGCCDGSLIRFTQQPSLIGPGFLTRKKFFGVRTAMPSPFYLCGSERLMISTRRTSRSCATTVGGS